MKMCSRSKDNLGVWDIKVTQGTTAYLCNDKINLSMGGVITPPGYMPGKEFRTVRDTYFHIEEMVADFRKLSSVGYIVLELPKNDIAKYIVVSMKGTVIKNG